MPAVLADRPRLADNALFITRMTGAVLAVATDVGAEASSASNNTQRMEKRTDLVRMVFADKTNWGARFAAAAAGRDTAGTDIADTFADTAGSDDVKQAAIADGAIKAFVVAAWDTLAGVYPVERGV